MITTKTITEMYHRGMYDSFNEYWDDMEKIMNIPFLKRTSSKRLLLRTEFGTDVKYFGIFELDYIYAQYRKKDDKFIAKVKRELATRKSKERLFEIQKHMNERFNKLFRKVNVNVISTAGL